MVGGIYNNLLLRWGIKWKWGKWVVLFPKNGYYSSLQLDYIEYHQKMRITPLRKGLSTFNFFLFGWLFFLFFYAFRQKIEPSWRTFELQTKVEHKFTNIQTASTLALRDHSNGAQIKARMRRGIIIFRIFVLKVISNERKFLTHHKIIVRIAEQSDQTWWSLKCAKNQNCGFIQIYGGQASH